jgi:hypothetical protein
MKPKKRQHYSTNNPTRLLQDLDPSTPSTIQEAKRRLADGFYHRPAVLQTVAERILQTMNLTSRRQNDSKDQ